MLNEFKLFASVNETVTKAKAAADGSNLDESINIEPYPFTGLDCIQAMQEASVMIMEEAVDFKEFYTISDELMMEAAISGNGTIYTLTEAVVGNIGQKFKSLLDKLIKIVLGLIEKLKAFVAKFFGKTDQWLKIMEPKINASTKTVDHEMYEWDTKYIIDTIPAGIESMRKEWETKFGKTSYQDMVNKARSVAEKYGKEENHAPVGMDEDQSREGSENKGDKMRDSIIHIFGVDGSDIKSAVDDIVVKAHGGKRDKDTVSVNSKKADMINFLKGAKKATDKLNIQLNDTVKALKDYRATLDTAKVDFVDQDEMNKSTLSNIRSALASKINMYSEYTTAYINAINQIGQLDLSMIQACSKDYMTALSKLVGGKAPKEDKAEEPKEEK